jgi:hypothetical protein
VRNELGAYRVCVFEAYATNLYFYYRHLDPPRIPKIFAYSPVFDHVPMDELNWVDATLDRYGPGAGCTKAG